YRRLKILLLCFAVVFLMISLIEGDQADPIRIELNTPIYDVEWNPAGTHAAVATEEGVIIYDQALQKGIKLPEWNKAVWSLSWNADGSALAAATGGEAEVLIWSISLTSDQHRLDRVFI